MIWEKGENIIGYGLIESSRVYKTGTSQAAAIFTNKIVRKFCGK
jgi:hypothetical protein